MRFHSADHGGQTHQTAIIGSPPEHRDHKPGDVIHEPEIAEGVRIDAYTIVDGGLFERTAIGARTWLMKRVHIGHDTHVGADCEIASGTVVGGHCVIGDGAKLGINSTIRSGVKIGAGAVVGCGAVVVGDVPAGETWAGNPARQLVPRPDIAITYTSGPDFTRPGDGLGFARQIEVQRAMARNGRA